MASVTVAKTLAGRFQKTPHPYFSIGTVGWRLCMKKGMFIAWGRESNLSTPLRLEIKFRMRSQNYACENVRKDQTRLLKAPRQFEVDHHSKSQRVLDGQGKIPLPRFGMDSLLPEGLHLRAGQGFLCSWIHTADCLAWDHFLFDVYESNQP